MLEEQKRYKIEKKVRYEDQVKQEGKNSINKAFLFGISAACSVYTLVNGSNKKSNLVIGLANTGVSAFYLKDLIETISRKTTLQGRIDDINAELEMAEIEENKGIRR